MGSRGNRDWHMNGFKNPVDNLEWNSFCMRYILAFDTILFIYFVSNIIFPFSYNITTRRMKFVHNGYLNVNHTRPPPADPETFEDFIPLDWFNPYSKVDGKKVNRLLNFIFFK